jgi:hypothetical protein
MAQFDGYLAENDDAAAFDQRMDDSIGHSIKLWNTKPQGN